MRTITKTVCTFQELFDLKAKGIERAREWLRQANTIGEWYEAVTNCWAEALAQIGFLDAEIQFTGFWSQGDGASFTANIDVERLADFLSREIAPEGRIVGEPEDFRPWIVHKCKGKPTDPGYERLKGIGEYLDEHVVKRISHKYCHEDTCQVQLSFQHGTYATLAEVADFERDAEKLRKSLCHAIYADLEVEYEYLTSDEALLELSEIHDYTFTIDGRRDG